MVNSIYFSEIREFQPYAEELVSDILIFKNNLQKNKDLLVSISSVGELTVWDMSAYQEGNTSFKLVQTFAHNNLESTSHLKDPIFLQASFDEQFRYLFVLNQNTLTAFEVNSIFHEKNATNVTIDCLFDRMFSIELKGEALLLASVQIRGNLDDSLGFESDVA